MRADGHLPRVSSVFPAEEPCNSAGAQVEHHRSLVNLTGSQGWRHCEESNSEHPPLLRTCSEFEAGFQPRGVHFFLVLRCRCKLQQVEGKEMWARQAQGNPKFVGKSTNARQNLSSSGELRFGPVPLLGSSCRGPPPGSGCHRHPAHRRCH